MNNTPNSDFNNNPPEIPLPTYEQVKKMMESRKSQREIILYILKTVGYITSEQMQYELGFYSGSKRISELKEQGHIIVKTQDWSRNGLATYWYKGKQENKFSGDDDE